MESFKLNILGVSEVRWNKFRVEIGKVGKTWKEVGALAQDRIHWRCSLEVPCFCVLDPIR
jgi:hypothetical protein